VIALNNVHVDNKIRQAAGQGQIGFRGILAALDDINYTGPVVAEVLPLPDDRSAVLNTAKFWKDMNIPL
jgi:sugar phosphate isomerase/epimerase